MRLQRAQVEQRVAFAAQLAAVGSFLVCMILCSRVSAAPQMDVPLGRPQVSQQLGQQQLQNAQPQAATQTSGQQQQMQPTMSSQGSSQQQQQLLNQKLQAHLSAIHAQAHRQLGQLVGSVDTRLGAGAQPQAANLTSPATGKYGNVLEALANVGKVIHQQIMSNPNGVQIVSSDPSSSSSSSIASSLLSPMSGNSKKNEYQSIVVNDNQPLVTSATGGPPGQASPLGAAISAGQLNATQIDYKQQGELLRQDILKRAGQLQQVVASSMDVLKNNGDLIVRRLLEQLNHRLDVAKSKADKIISEPATNEVALKALGTINQGLNNLNNIITNIVNRMDLSAKDGQQLQRVSANGNGESPAQPAASPFLDPNRLKLNLQQIQQQFHSALAANQQANQQGGKLPPLSQLLGANSAHHPQVVQNHNQRERAN